MPETTKMSLVGRRSFWAAISSARSTPKSPHRIAESMPGDGQLSNDPFEAVQALVPLGRALLSLRLAFQDEFFEAIEAFVSFHDGFFEAVQAFVGSVRALLGLRLTLYDEFDGLFEVHPVEYSKSLYAPAVVAKAGCQAYRAPVRIPISRSPRFLPLSR